MNLVLSPVSIPELVSLIADEVSTRILNRQPISTTPPTTPEPIRLYGDRAAAGYLGCSIMTIQALRRSGAISFYRTGRKVFYISSELDESLKVQARKFNKKSTKV
jgi:excisionase family DNA binding protein